MKLTLVINLWSYDNDVIVIRTGCFTSHPPATYTGAPFLDHIYRDPYNRDPYSGALVLDNLYRDP